MGRETRVIKIVINNIKSWVKANSGKVLFAVLIIACFSEIIIAPSVYFSALKREEAKRAETEMTKARVSRVDALIMAIGDEPTSRRVEVQVAREAYDALSESEQSEVVAYPVLRQAELKIKAYDDKLAEEERIRKEKEEEEKALARREAEEKAAAERVAAEAASKEAQNEEINASGASDSSQTAKTSSQDGKTGSNNWGTDQILQDILTDLTKIQNEVLEDVLGSLQ